MPRLDSEIQLCTCLERFRVPQGAMFFRPIKTRASSLLLLCSFAKATLQMAISRAIWSAVAASGLWGRRPTTQAEGLQA